MDARNATAKDFESAAQSKANAFWFWAIVAGIIAFMWHWWAILPAVIAIFRMTQSIYATKMAGALRDGTYSIPNPNNGAPDGDAANIRHDKPAGS